MAPCPCRNHRWEGLVSKWLHFRKGVIEGELISDDGTWTRIRLKGDHELRSAKPGRRLLFVDEEYLDVRTSFLTPMEDSP